MNQRPSKLRVLLAKIGITLKVFVYMSTSCVSLLYYWLFRRTELDGWLDGAYLAFAHYLLAVQRVQLNVLGAARLAAIDWSRPVFIVANHQSYVDIPVLVAALDRGLGFVTKIELARIPILSFWMRQVGCLIVERGKAGAGKEIDRAIKNMKRPPRLVVFAEGTRSKDGRLGPFMSGAFRMALHHKGILLPIALRGSRQGWEERIDFRTPHSVSCQVLEPIDCAKLSDDPAPPNSDTLKLRVRSEIDAALNASPP